jgi:mono/diheme cytochrome c family protein
MKNTALFFLVALFLYACGGGNNDKSIESLQSADDGKGYGEITEVKLNDPLNPDMVDRGLAIYDMKCSACHKLTSQRVVGPGWAGLTEKRKPEWIMNMITNVDVMLEKDPSAQKLLEECLTRMPNQNVSVGDARDILEFIYQNDADQKEKS